MSTATPNDCLWSIFRSSPDGSVSAHIDLYEDGELGTSAILLFSSDELAMKWTHVLNEVDGNNWLAQGVLPKYQSNFINELVESSEFALLDCPADTPEEGLLISLLNLAGWVNQVSSDSSE